MDISVRDRAEMIGDLMIALVVMPMKFPDLCKSKKD